MTRTTATEEIIRLCDRIAAEHGPHAVTYDAVKQARGGGSYSTIGVAVRQWRALRGHDAAHSETAADDGMTELLGAWTRQKQQLEQQHLRDIESIQRRADERVDIITQQADLKVSALEARCHRLAEENEQLTGILAGMQDRQHKMECQMALLIEQQALILKSLGINEGENADPPSDEGAREP